MDIVELTYKVTLRRFMKPILIIGALTKWDWLVNLCFKMELIREGEEVTLHGDKR